MLPAILRDIPVAGPLLAYLTLLVLLLLAGWVWGVIRLRQRRRNLQAAYTDALLERPTDPMPVGNDDQPSPRDTLGFSAVAQAVAGLLLNKATGAPYSVVISGNWGSGKSSVMIQVKDALKNNAAGLDIKTIWLNVWHYQTGQHLLAAFLRKLLAACDTPPYRRRFRRFRFRNLGFWNGLQFGLTVCLLGPAVLYLTWLLWEPLLMQLGWDDDVKAAAQWLDESVLVGHFNLGHALTAPFRLLNNAPDLLKGVRDQSPGSEGTASQLPIWGTVLAWLGTLLGLLRALRTNGDVVRELVPLRQFEQAATQADTGFRDQYREELQNVLKFAPPGTRLVFFVDDVDRIPGERVLELLESLNFLVEACREARREAGEDPDAGARLYFVLGMHVPEVVRALADALDPNKRIASSAEAHRRAARYLEKLVDLVVPMPTLSQCDPDQIARLLFGGEEPTPKAPALPVDFQSNV
jgi:hypothetical protein